MSEDLFAAVKAGDVAALQALLDSDPALADATENGLSAVLVATYHRQAAARDALIGAGAAIGPLEAAALGRTEPLDPAARAADGFTALHLAAYFGGAAAVAALLAAGAPPDGDAENPFQVRPIHAAVSARNYDAARLLLEAGADPNVRQQGGYTPLDSARHSGDQPLIDLLVAAGAGVNP